MKWLKILAPVWKGGNSWPTTPPLYYSQNRISGGEKVVKPRALSKNSVLKRLLYSYASDYNPMIVSLKSKMFVNIAALQMTSLKDAAEL